MKNRVEEMAARMRAAKETGGKSMWHLVLADATITLLARHGAVTPQMLLDFMKTRMAETADEPLLRDGYETAIEELMSRTSSAE